MQEYYSISHYIQWTGDETKERGPTIETYRDSVAGL